MGSLGGLFPPHPFWVWLAIGAMFLTLEVITGSGWMLWPAGAAVFVAIIDTIIPLGSASEILVFAGATIVTTYLGRRFLRGRRPSDGPDVNDPLIRLIGHVGTTIGAFHSGTGRVFVDGKEWAAELEDGGALAAGDKVEVTAVLTGARLRVRAFS